MYNLPAAALAAALPLLRQRFAGWQPLAEPDRGLRDMQRWRPLLQSDSARDAIFQVRHHGTSAVLPPCFHPAGHKVTLSPTSTQDTIVKDSSCARC